MSLKLIPFAFVALRLFLPHIAADLDLKKNLLQLSQGQECLLVQHQKDAAAV